MMSWQDAGYHSCYQYSRLRSKEIRLMRLHPAQFDDVLKLDIVHRALDFRDLVDRKDRAVQELHDKLPQRWRSYQTPEGRQFYWFTGSDFENKYARYKNPSGRVTISSPGETNDSLDFEALSYTWGDVNQQEAVIIMDSSGHEKNMRGLSICQNLATALRHLRSSADARTFWADAVCIDQSNIEEKASQVRGMHHIYRLASRVVVWLGEKCADSCAALDLLRHLGRQIEISTDGWLFPAFDPEPSGPDWYDKEVILPYSSEDWQAITSLFSRPWFDRLWVLQEVNANPNTTILCGSDSIDWYHLRRAIAVLDDKSGAPASLSERLRKKLTVALGCITPFRETVLVARQHLCQDPRDKIYGLLSLFGPKMRHQLVPSYPTDFTELYKDVFLTCSAMTRRLDLLSQCFLGDVPSDLPSWVCDWRLPCTHEYLGPENGYQASGASPAEFQHHGSQLFVAGTIHDTVVSVAAVPGSGTGGRINLIRGPQPARLHQSTYVTGEPLLKA